MSVAQSEFTRSLLDPDLGVPKGLADPEGRPAGRRFSVYRNNVAVSLTDALRQAFPVVLKLVGDAFFDAMAGVYLRQHPPSSPLMMFYGELMPDFLESFPPVAHLGYLPDVARLELFLRRSYHAADSARIDPAVLGALPAETLLATRLELAPSVFLLRSQWPVFSIWRENTRDDAPPVVMEAQDVMIARREFDPLPVVLPTGGGSFVNAIGKGETFATALDAAGDEFDLTNMLAVLLENGAIVRVSEGD